MPAPAPRPYRVEPAPPPRARHRPPSRHRPHARSRATPEAANGPCRAAPNPCPRPPPCPRAPPEAAPLTPRHAPHRTVPQRAIALRHPPRRAVARGWAPRHLRHLPPPSSPCPPPSASAVAHLAALHRWPRPALPPSTAGVPPAPVEANSPRVAPGIPRPPRATVVVYRATAGPDLWPDPRPSSAGPKRRHS
ncbi:36.4 kDa proline-rich protein-like [Miscanthus floridulus]|uniref:36.4 kDa proline-rich protein-like n=1 Tax=Miscanthus floridulus TaxID=154761 RepID=UPI0034585D51